MRYFLLLFIPFLYFNLFAQTSHLEEQVQSYEDGKSTLINKARLQLLDHFIAQDIDKMSMQKDYLISLEDDDYFSLFPGEYWLILYWTKGYEELLKDYAAFSLEEAELYKLRIKPNQDQLYLKLKEYTLVHFDTLCTLITASEQTEEEKAFLKLGLNNLINDIKKIPEYQDTLNVAAEEFLGLYPNSDYTFFTRQYIRYQLKPKDWGIGFGLFSGRSNYTNELNEWYKRATPIGFNFDICYKKLELHLRHSVSFLKNRKNLEYNNTRIYPGESNMLSYQPDANVALVLMDMPYYRIVPFVGYGFTNIVVPTSELEMQPKYEKVNMDFTSTYSIGMNIDLKFGTNLLPQFATKSSYGYIRVRYAYCFPQFENKYDARSGGFHNFTIGVGGIARRLERDL